MSLELGSTTAPRFALVKVAGLRVELQPQYPTTHAHGIDWLPSESYIQVYMHPSLMPHPSLYGTLRMGVGESGDWIFPRAAAGGAWVGLLLFLVRRNPDGVACAFQAGSTRQLIVQDFIYKKELAVTVSDERHVVVGQVRFRVEVPLPMPVVSGQMPPTPPLLRPIAGGVMHRAVSNPALNDLCEVTPTVFSPHTPKWILAHQLESPHEPSAEGYWVEAVHTACAITAIGLHDFLHAPLKYPELLGQVLGLLGWQTPYLTDAGNFNGRLLVTDQWRVVNQMIWWRAGDCEDFARSAYAGFHRILAGEHDTSPELEALRQLAARYCPFLVESAIADSYRHDNAGFAGQRTGKTDPVTCIPLGMHLYCKLLPWTTVLRLLPTKTAATVRKGLAPEVLTFEGPVVAIESTDRNVTDWSDTQPYALTRQIRHRLSRWGADQASILSRVQYLVSPTQFHEENFYRYDCMLYSKRLFDLIQGAVPFWLATMTGPATIGVPPIGLLGQHTTPDLVRLVPGDWPGDLPALEQQVLGELPQLPPLMPPTGTILIQTVAALVAEIPRLQSLSQAPLPQCGVLILRMGAAGDAHHHSPWSATEVEQLLDAVTTDTGLTLRAHCVCPVMGADEGVWVWYLK